MEPTLYSSLKAYLNSSHCHALASELSTIWLPSPTSPTQFKETNIGRCQESITCIEKNFASRGIDQTLLTLYQALFRELEKLITAETDLHRHKFIITIPIADRPKHLERCLGSLLRLCNTYRYGEKRNNRFNKICVLIADDSKQKDNISKNKTITEYYNQQGIETLYFGQHEQLTLLRQLPHLIRTQLTGIIGSVDKNAFFHKGASITRNITYLKLHQLSQNTIEEMLFYFIDSDQEFQVSVSSSYGDELHYALNYFYYLDRIFTTTDIGVLTGKVVGDPPVSPAVMADNFLLDIADFLATISNSGPGEKCTFHDTDQQAGNNAAYHDMADLFGFEPSNRAFKYQCNISDNHDHSQCFMNFAQNLDNFFDGEHPTRKNHYDFIERLEDTAPARTVYTGNYILKPEHLNYFIPFAPLKLRMAGPALGRLIKADIGTRFVTANLPMLHKRTVTETGQSEFRSGINRKEKQVDLSVEFERQFYGDIMLFSIEKLSHQGYPIKKLSSEQIKTTVLETENAIHQTYLTKQQQIWKKLVFIEAQFNNNMQWWNHDKNLEDARNKFQIFFKNIAYNFGESATGYRQINNQIKKQHRLNDIVCAVKNYYQDKENWDNFLAGIT